MAISALILGFVALGVISALGVAGFGISVNNNGNLNNLKQQLMVLEMIVQNLPPPPNVTETVLITGTCTSADYPSIEAVMNVTATDFGNYVQYSMGISNFSAPQQGSQQNEITCGSIADISVILTPFLPVGGKVSLFTSLQLNSIITTGPNAPFYPLQYDQDITSSNYQIRRIGSNILLSWTFQPNAVFDNSNAWNFADNGIKFVIGNSA